MAPNLGLNPWTEKVEFEEATMFQNGKKLGDCRVIKPKKSKKSNKAPLFSQSWEIFLTIN